MQRNFRMNISCKLIIIVTALINLSLVSLQTCKEKPIELNVENADVILTGTVRKIERNYSQQQYGAYIEIHRIIKGHDQIYEIYNMNYENAFSIEMQKNLSKRTNRNSINGHVIFVYNFGNLQICEAVVSPHDVGIYLLSIDAQNRLYLNSSVIKPILTKVNNLNVISANENTYDIKTCNFALIINLKN